MITYNWLGISKLKTKEDTSFNLRKMIKKSLRIIAQILLMVPSAWSFSFQITPRSIEGRVYGLKTSLQRCLISPSAEIAFCSSEGEINGSVESTTPYYVFTLEKEDGTEEIELIEVGKGPSRILSKHLFEFDSHLYACLYLFGNIIDMVQLSENPNSLTSVSVPFQSGSITEFGGRDQIGGKSVKVGSFVCFPANNDDGKIHVMELVTGLLMSPLDFKAIDSDPFDSTGSVLSLGVERFRFLVLSLMRNKVTLLDVTKTKNNYLSQYVVELNADWKPGCDQGYIDPRKILVGASLKNYPLFNLIDFTSQTPKLIGRSQHQASEYGGYIGSSIIAIPETDAFFSILGKLNDEENEVVDTIVVLIETMTRDFIDGNSLIPSQEVTDLFDFQNGENILSLAMTHKDHPTRPKLLVASGFIGDEDSFVNAYNLTSFCDDSCFGCTDFNRPDKCLACSDTQNYKLRAGTCEMICHRDCLECAQPNDLTQCTSCLDPDKGISEDSGIGQCVSRGENLSTETTCNGVVIVGCVECKDDGTATCNRCELGTSLEGIKANGGGTACVGCDIENCAECPLLIQADGSSTRECSTCKEGFLRDKEKKTCTYGGIYNVLEGVLLATILFKLL